MPILIDGHNLIGQMADISLSDPDDEAQLISRLAAYARRRRSQITVVFDAGAPGLPAEERHAGIRVIYARPGRRADDVICALVRQARDRRGWLVVTCDRAVQDEVRRLGATVIPANDFARQLGPAPRPQAPAEKERPPTPGEVDDWLRIFARRDRRPGR